MSAGVEQMTLYGIYREGELSDEMVEDFKRQVAQIAEYDKKKRKWENAFQKWSNDHGIEATEHIDSYGCCGYGSMCDWCEDNSYGRPCVRALNTMCREKRMTIDYTDFDFTKIW